VNHPVKGGRCPGGEAGVEQVRLEASERQRGDLIDRADPVVGEELLGPWSDQVGPVVVDRRWAAVPGPGVAEESLDRLVPLRRPCPAGRHIETEVILATAAGADGRLGHRPEATPLHRKVQPNGSCRG
jgi:hypothetical protein